MLQKRQVLFISGTPGVGKSTLCKELEKFNFFHLDVGKVVVKKRLYLKYDRKTSSFIVSVKRIKTLVKRTVRKTEGNIAVDWMHSYELADSVQGSAKKVIVLRCDPLTLYKRISKKYGVKKTKENVLSEFLNQISHEAHESLGNVIEFDTTKTKPKKIALRLINDNVKAGRRIDWMKKYSRNKSRLKVLLKIVEK